MINFKEKTLKNYKFIDLFAGLGGFRLALESLGANCVYSSEIDSSVKEVYKINFNEMPDGDITKVNENEIPEHDILCAGFPCQAFSISGKKLGFNDARGTLFFDVARIVKAKKPKVVFLENVKNFSTHDNGKTLKVVKSTMEEIGYDFNYSVLNSADYGLPQNRERIYMVCFRKDLKIQNFKFPEPIKLTKHLEDFLLDENSITNLSELFIERDDLQLKKTINEKYSSRPIRVGMVNKGGQGERIYSPKGIAITFSANGGGVFSKTGGYLIDGKIRKLHPRECANIMGFPESFKIHEKRNQAYKHFGNSVVVDVLQIIAKEFSKHL